MEQIESRLKTIEQTKGVRILYACETGSRAWGFPSPDSDYDVRFIYMHDKDWYLSLNHEKDTIEFMDGELDITGWDLKKSLILLKKSNVPLIERFQSPIVYCKIDEFVDDFKSLIQSYYSPTAVFFHHFSLAKKFWEEIKDVDEFRLKSCFYLIRSLLSCSWVIRDKAVLPMHMEGLMKYVSNDKREYLRKLMLIKAGVGEQYLYKRDEFLYDWIIELLMNLEQQKDNLGVNSEDMSLLNKFFLRYIYV